MSALTDDLHATLNPPEPCKACRVLDSMPEEDRQAIADAILQGVPPKTLSRVMTRNGYQLSDRSIAKHREKGHQ